jgi:hypothetical protein
MESSGRETKQKAITNTIIQHIFGSNTSLLYMLLTTTIVKKTILKLTYLFKKKFIEFKLKSLPTYIIAYVNLVSLFSSFYKKLDAATTILNADTTILNADTTISKNGAYLCSKLIIIIIEKILENLISAKTNTIISYTDILNMDNDALKKLFTINFKNKINYIKRINNSLVKISVSEINNLSLFDISDETLIESISKIKCKVTGISENRCDTLKRYVLDFIKKLLNSNFNINADNINDLIGQQIYKWDAGVFPTKLLLLDNKASFNNTVFMRQTELIQI